MFQKIKTSLHQLYLEDERPWLVGFIGGKDSTKLASPIFDVVLEIPAEQRKKPISVLCTDKRVEISAVSEMIEGTLDRVRKCSHHHGLNIEANLALSGHRDCGASYLRCSLTLDKCTRRRHYRCWRKQPWARPRRRDARPSLRRLPQPVINVENRSS